MTQIETDPREPRAETTTAAPPRAADAPLRLALPKGRLQAGTTELLVAAGLRVRPTGRAYRPGIDGFGPVDAKLLKPQNIVRMLDAGARDVGFAGADWIREAGSSSVVELVDTGLDPVRIVAAAPPALLGPDGALPRRPLTVATEYEALTREWARARGLEVRILRTYGATEVFPPEDADLIVDNTATGATLAANGLEVVDELMTSTTRLAASRRALDDPERGAAIERLVLLTRSVLEARGRVMVDLNVGEGDLASVLEVLPSMRRPTVSSLGDGAGVAVRSAVPRSQVAELVPALKAAGASDIVISAVSQLVP